MKYKELLRAIKVHQWFLIRSLVFLSAYTLMAVFYSETMNLVYGKFIILTDKYIAYLLYPVWIFFFLLYRHRIAAIPKIRANKKRILLSIFFILCSFGILFAPIHLIPNIQKGFINIAIFAVFCFSTLFLLLGVCGVGFLNNFFVEIIAIVFIFFLFVLTQLAVLVYWPHMSEAIIYALSLLFPLFTEHSSFDIGRYLAEYHDFRVYIGPVCAGFYSLVTFFLFYIITIFFLQRNYVISYMRTAVSLIVGLILVFLLNILRVAIIIVIGGMVSETLAIELFHEYLSAIFLIVVFMLYLHFLIPRLIKHKKKNKKQR